MIAGKKIMKYGRANMVEAMTVISFHFGREFI